MVRALSITTLSLLVALPLALALWGALSEFSAVLNSPKLIADTVFNWLTPLQQTVTLTLFTALLVGLCSFAVARHLLRSRWFSRLSVVLATPHVAFAVGVMFLLSPSGYLVRLVAALTNTLPTPPAGWPLPEKSLLTLTLVLVLKEVPFMLLMIATQIRQLPAQRWLLQAQSLGWSARRGWWLLLVPELLTRLKLPLAAVIIYTVSVVDIPLLVGPNAPGVLAVVVFEQHYQWGNVAEAATGVWLLMSVAGGMLLLNQLAVVLYRRWAAWARARCNKTSRRFGRSLSRGLAPLLVVLSAAALLALMAQSLAGRWFYPDLLPNEWHAKRWLTEWPYIAPLLWHSFWVATVSAGLSVIAAVLVLERQRQCQQQQLKLLPLVMLLMPQLLLVLGWQTLLGQGSQGAVLVWSHAVFGFPYAYLVMQGAWVNFNSRWLYQAQSLGYSYAEAWWRVLLPMLKIPLITAFAMAFSVSIAQYLPTLWLAGGTLPTLTTEAVSIASGGDWRLASVYALMQALLPLFLFVLVMSYRQQQRESDVSY